MVANWIAITLTQFGFVMFCLAVIFMLLNRLVTRGRVPEHEIVYRWIVLFSVGFTGLYAAFMHVFYPEIAASAIGWTVSPFQYEVAMADLGFAIIGILSFNASYSFRLAAVIGNVIWLWGDATGHIYQMVKYQDYAMGNAGTWFWLDVFVPLIIIVCLKKMKKTRL